MDTATIRTEDELINDVRCMIAAADKPVSISRVQRELRIGYNRAAALLEAAQVEPSDPSTTTVENPDAEAEHGPEWGTTAHAQVFMLGRMIDAAKKRFTHLAEPWSKLSEREQERVLEGLAGDMRDVAKDAVKIIAANGRMTFRAEVESVQFKGPTDVKASLKLVNTPETHALADAAGGFVTIVIESLDEMLAIPEGATAGEPDNRPLFDESTGGAGPDPDEDGDSEGGHPDGKTQPGDPDHVAWPFPGTANNSMEAPPQTRTARGRDRTKEALQAGAKL